MRTPDGKSHETVRSALKHRATTTRARVLSVSRGGLPPIEVAGADRARSRCLSAVAMLTAASTGRQRGSESEALTASAPVAGGRITDMACFVKTIYAVSGNAVFLFIARMLISFVSP